MYNDILLDPLIEKTIDEIERLEPGSNERSRAVSDLTNLLNARLNRKKDEDAYTAREHESYVEFQKDEANRKREKELDERKRKSEMKDRITKIVLETLGIGAPLIVYMIFMNKGFEFEKTGSYTSGTFRNLINKLGSRKK